MLVFNYVLSLQVTLNPLIRRQNGLITGSHVIGGENLNRITKGKEKDRMGSQKYRKRIKKMTNER